MGLFSKKNIDETVCKLKPTKIIGPLMLDEEQRKWMTADSILGKNGARVYDYNEILDYELLQDGETLTKGGLGGAVAGGLLFGGVGAIVGGVTGRKTKSVVNSLKVKITINDINTPAVFITLLNGPEETSSPHYQHVSKKAQEILSTLEIIMNGNTPDQPTARQALLEADDIRKFKELLDEGIITQEEFEAKKKQLLGI